MNFDKMFSTIDAHVAGKAFRIVTQSPIVLDEASVEENDELLQANYQNEKALLLNEPRGHRDMNGCIVVPSEEADLGLLFFNHEKRKNFTYSGLIATLTALLETGNLAKSDDDVYKIETIRGIFTLTAPFTDGEVMSVYVENASHKLNEKQAGYESVTVDDHRTYLLAALPESIAKIHVDHLVAIMSWGRTTCAELAREGVSFDGIVVTEKISEGHNHVRSVTFSPDGNIVRSPGIAGTFALLATQSGESKQLNESIFGSRITAQRVPDSTRLSVETEAFVTGVHEFILTEDDALEYGFLLG